MCSSAFFIFLFFIPLISSENVPEQFVKIEHIKVCFLNITLSPNITLSLTSLWTRWLVNSIWKNMKSYFSWYCKWWKNVMHWKLRNIAWYNCLTLISFGTNKLDIPTFSLFVVVWYFYFFPRSPPNGRLILHDGRTWTVGHDISPEADGWTKSFRGGLVPWEHWFRK